MELSSEGIKVSIAQRDKWQWPMSRNPNFMPSDGFVGSLHSVEFPATPDTSFHVDVEFTEKFRLFSATGVAVAIAIGGKSTQLDMKDNGQVVLLQGCDCSIRKLHRFSKFDMWQSGCSPNESGRAPLEIPTPDAADANADPDWLKDEGNFKANPGCIAVRVWRVKCIEPSLQPGSEGERSINEPPECLRMQQPVDGREVVDGAWLRRLGGQNGRSFVFEFVNRDPDAINQRQEQASPQIGTQTLAPLDTDGHVDEFLDQHTTTNHISLGNEGQLNTAESEGFHFPQNQRLAFEPQLSTNDRPQRKRAGAEGIDTDRPKRAKTTPVSNATGYHHDRDNGEALAVVQAPDIRAEDQAPRDSRRSQEPTPQQQQNGVRETTQDLHGLTPERRMLGGNIAQSDNQQDQVRQRNVSKVEGQGDFDGLDEETKLEYEVEKAEIEREHKLELARIRAKKSALAKQRQSVGR